MKIMLIGSGGREHALAWKLTQSDLVTELIAVPGNPGIAREARCRCLDLPSHGAMVDYAAANAIDLVVVGPEGPLVDGIADDFRARGIAVLGPGAIEARLEGSKAFAKEFMNQYGVATAAYAAFTDLAAAREYLKMQAYPLVVKASGICAGKGVIICPDLAQAETALREIMADHKFADAGSTVVIEECLTGPEVSVLALYDGQTIRVLGSARDHKRAQEGDLGLNTGGMGTVAPAPDYTENVQADFMQNILQPTLTGLQDRSMTDPACIFFGLMITPDGARLLEYNMRFGDPETQSILMLLESDLAELFADTVSGKLAASPIRLDDTRAFCVIGAAKGYPENYEKNIPLTFAEKSDIKVFLAGVREADGKLYSSGGRIFGATARGEEARAAILNYLELFRDQPIFWRSDIGLN